MKDKLKIVLAQLNLTVGDIQGNLKKHIDAAISAREQHHADLIVFPELGITGYPPEDLLLRKTFIDEAVQATKTFASEVQGIHALIGHPYPGNRGLLNSCSLVYNGTVLGHYAKQYLPNYTVFDEDRYFVPDTESCVVEINGVKTGLIICEDIWFQEPASKLAAQDAKIILCINASPFITNKHEKRIAILSERAKNTNTHIVYVNNVGGQDELVFDGGSMAINPKGEMTHFAGFFKEALMPVEIVASEKLNTLEKIGAAIKQTFSVNSIRIPDKLERTYQALVLAIRDYVTKNNISGVLIGLSGGIDSALTLTLAVDALGKERVHAVTMPSRYTASISNDDAKILAENLGVKFDSISIEDSYKAFLDTLTPEHINETIDVTHENIQARCRAVILMALSNQSGYLVLTTGNRSEIAVGYCTLYGDMAGGFAPLKDVAKTMVYALAKYRNSINHVIPERTIDRPPTAELSPGQKDEDSLPPYSTLDLILEAYLNESKSMNEIIAAGFDKETVHQIINLVKKSEYKRKQSATGPRINDKSFGKDWRYPVTNKFDD